MSEIKEVPINSLDETITSHLHMSTLRLFKALPVTNQKKQAPSKSICEESINHGFIFSSVIASNFSERDQRSLISIVAKEYGLTPAQMNSTFHKSWTKIRDAPFGQLLAEQCYHYMTTYGYKAIGRYDEMSVFIPNERLDIPEISDGIKLIIINGYTKNQLREKLLALINSGIALNNIDDIVVIAEWVGVTDEDVLCMRNKEVRVQLYSKLDLLPADPVEVLRLAIYETTNKTLLITNMGMVAAIKDSENREMPKLFAQYDEEFGFKRMAQIFNRFKRIFLAFKTLPDMSSSINKISRLSKKYHKPMRQDLLNNITSMLSKGEPLYASKLNPELERVNIWRKIRLAQSLKYRLTGNTSILYKVRNGKAYATTIDFKATDSASKVYDIIIDSIANDLKHLKGKEFYIPENVVYSLPATAKQFSGNIPTGSYIKCGNDMIFGVHWKNEQGQTDLDLHATALNAGDIGFNSQYRSANRGILFTGDITDAPNGATELLYINKDYNDIILVTMNYFNYRENVPVPYKFMIGDEAPQGAFENNHHYTIDANNMKCSFNNEIDVNQVTLGLASVQDGECRFYFSSSGLGDTNAIKGGEYVTLARNYMANYFKTQITFNEVLEKVGAKIVTKPTKNSVDLSLEALEKDTFIKLLIDQ